jgi:hypothetical protein
MRAAKALGKEGITILPAAKLRLGLAAPPTASPAVARFLAEQAQLKSKLC